MAEHTPRVDATQVSGVAPRNTGSGSARGGVVEEIDAATRTARAISADAVAAASGESSPAAPDMPDFSSPAPLSTSGFDLGLLDDVALHVKIELGRTQMYVEDVLRLNTASVVELDKAAGDPVDIYVNDRHVARGEVLVLNENYCVRISEIIPEQTVRDNS